MPKAYRGGKGRAEKPLTEEEKEFIEIDRTKDGIAVVRAKPGVKNFNFPLYSNSPDTVYFALDKNDGTRKAIGIYKDYQLVQTIDYDKVRKEHFHDWGSPQIVRGRMSLTRPGKENFNLTDEHKRLIKQFNEWWNNRG